MVFNFLKLYLEKRASLEPKEALNAIAHAFSIATGQFRATQAAYNTLYKNGKTADFNKDKIEALLRYENPKLSVINHSKEINLNVEGVDEVLMSYLNTAPDGVFVVRSLRPLLTEEELDGEPYEIDDPEFLKGEQYGHSTLWIKSKGENFYYDPAVGIIQIHDLRQLPMILQWEHYRWTLPNVRFYQVS